MATRKIRIGITAGITDHDKSVPEVRDQYGNIARAATPAIKHIPPGEWFEVDEAEADRLEAMYPYQVYEIAKAQDDIAWKRSDERMPPRKTLKG